MSFSAYFFIYRPKRKHAKNKAKQNTKIWEEKKIRTMENWMWGDRRSRRGLEHVKPAKKQLK